MKLIFSIGLNVVLILLFGLYCLGHQLDDHYYKEFTGMVLRKCAEQIEAGNHQRVAKVLNETKGRPTHGDLSSMLQKMENQEPAKQSTAADADKPSN
jgi:hypothetical protein